MPDLIIDNRPVTVQEGTRIIDAAEELGIMIPRFCYLKALGAVGACRMCAVHFLEGPVKGVEMSCMVEAQDGMVIATGDREAVDFRRQVIEWLMANHPHDCPVCDEGGQCLLQDETVSGGHGIRRYPGRKRTYRDQYLGPFIQQEMNRCIHCYRCARFYREYSGYRDFGVMQIGNRIFYGRFADGSLESPFAGNLVDICPTGVFTDKPARYRARRWDMQRADSICIHCSLGCSTTTNSFHREIIRQEGRENTYANGSFICDRGRFGCFYANRADRPWQPRVDQNEVDWDRALTETAARMQRILDESGPQAIACLGSTRMSLENMAALQAFSQTLGGVSPVFFTDPALEQRTRRAVARLHPELAISLARVEEGDCVLVIGIDPVNEAPMLALALRQTVRRGGSVTVVDPRPVDLPLAFTQLAAAPSNLPALCGLLFRRAFERKNIEHLGEAGQRFYKEPEAEDAELEIPDDLIRTAAENLAACRRPLVICGTGIVDETMPDFAADLARLLHGIKGECGLLYTMPGPNGFAAVLAGEEDGMNFPVLLDGIEQGEIKALVTAEADPFHDFCDGPRLEKTLAGLELLVCLDCLPGKTAGRSHIVLPTATHFETGAEFINQAGRLQRSEAVHESGRPLSLITAGSHPRRDYAEEDESYAPRPVSQILNDMAARLTGKSIKDKQYLLQESIAAQVRQLQQMDGPGVRNPEDVPARSARQEVNRDQGLELILTDLTFGTEELSSFSPPADGSQTEPRVIMHKDEAAAAGLVEGDTVVLQLDRGTLQLSLKTASAMARGCAVLPRLAGINWHQLAYRPGEPYRCRIAKA